MFKEKEKYKDPIEDIFDMFKPTKGEWLIVGIATVGVLGAVFLLGAWIL